MSNNFASDNIKIFNMQVYGIREALIRAGYPMKDVVNMDMSLDLRTVEDMLKLGNTLGSSPIGHGDDKFLRQCLVCFDILAPRYFYQQLATYGFMTMNSQSTMHKGKSLDYDLMSNKHVDPVILGRFKELVKEYQDNPSEKTLMAVKSNLPEGIRLAAGISTNYAQLKTIYYQRKHHRLPEWRDFCEWIKELPYAKVLGVTRQVDK